MHPPDEHPVPFDTLRRDVCLHGPHSFDLERAPTEGSQRANGGQQAWQKHTSNSYNGRMYRWRHRLASSRTHLVDLVADLLAVAVVISLLCRGCGLGVRAGRDDDGAVDDGLGARDLEDDAEERL